MILEECPPQFILGKRDRLWAKDVPWVALPWVGILVWCRLRTGEDLGGRVSLDYFQPDGWFFYVAGNGVGNCERGLDGLVDARGAH